MQPVLREIERERLDRGCRTKTNPNIRCGESPNTWRSSSNRSLKENTGEREGKSRFVIGSVPLPYGPDLGIQVGNGF